MVRVQKGVCEPGHRSQSRRFEYQDLDADGCPWEFGPICFATRPMTRSPRCGATARRHRSASIAGRQSVRCRLVKTTLASTGLPSGDCTKIQSPSAFADRYGGLQVEASDRELLLQAQGIQAHSNAQRQDRQTDRQTDRQQLRCCHHVGISCDQFTLNLNTP